MADPNAQCTHTLDERGECAHVRLKLNDLECAKQSLVEALRHTLYRNHTFYEGCDGCWFARSALKKAEARHG